jgi:phosphatidylinositol-3-phosphatase
MITPFKNRSHYGLLKKSLFAIACASSLTLTSAHAQVTTVFYILLENRNWTQSETSNGVQILGDTTDCPFLNSLVTPGNPNSAQVSYASCYHNDLANAVGNNPSIHPSEPNYVWMESGSNLSKLDDNDPYGSSDSVEQIFDFVAATPTATGENLSLLLQNAGISWKSYTEEVNQLNSSGANFNTAGGTLSNNIASPSLYTVPLVSFSGTSTSYVNPYNGTHQFNFACKHTGQLFFPGTNGSTVNTADTSTTNVAASHYPPLPQLATDLANNAQGAYNVITPDQFNDMHTGLTASKTTPWVDPETGTSYTASSNNEQVAQGDNFCSIVVPEIMNSPVYKAGHAAIVLWTDETEGTPANDFNHTLLEIVISPLAKGNAFDSTLNYTHSSDIATMQKIFGVSANTPSGFLNDSANASNSSNGAVGTSQVNGSSIGGTAFTQAASPTGGFGTGTAQDMSDLFQPGVIPAALPGLPLTASGYVVNRHSGADTQTVTVTNVLSGPVSTPIYLVLGGLSSNTTLTNSAGTTVNNAPGSPYVLVSQNGLAAGASATVTLQFTAPTSGTISSTMSAITTDSQP